MDDLIPTSNGEPIFAKPNGKELWVVLLEKAIAKCVGARESRNCRDYLRPTNTYFAPKTLHYSPALMGFSALMFVELHGRALKN